MLLQLQCNCNCNAGKVFVRFVHKLFHCHHKYHKLFNRNNIKLSYSCMPNTNNAIQKHNCKIMKDPALSTIKTCKCCQKQNALWMETISKCLIHKASVNTTTNKYYNGTCENPFKECYNNHTCSFRNESYEKNIECLTMYGH